MNSHSSSDDAKTVNAWLDAHHDQAVDAVSFASSPVAATVHLLMKQPEFVDWDKLRIEDAVTFDENDHQMAGMEGNLQEMHATDIVGWIGDGYALCPDHITEEEANAQGMQPVFVDNEGWEDIICDDHGDGPHTLGDSAGMSEEMTMGSSPTTVSPGLTLENLISQAVKKGINSAITETRKPKARKITRSQLAEGVRKALRMALKESGMPGGVMPGTGMAAGAPVSAPTQEEDFSDGEGTKRGSMSGGIVPSPEELQAAIDENGGWDMNLQGENSLALTYALEVAGLGNPNTSTGQGMHAVLTALSTCPAPDDLPDSVDDEDISNPHSHLNKILDSWEVRYGRGGHRIEDAAQSLASSILDSLGWEWV